MEPLHYKRNTQCCPATIKLHDVAYIDCLNNARLGFETAMAIIEINFQKTLAAIDEGYANSRTVCDPMPINSIARELCESTIANERKAMRLAAMGLRRTAQGVRLAELAARVDECADRFPCATSAP